MKRRFLLVGQVIVDVLWISKRPHVRMGGVFHAARAFSAIGQDVTIAYIAPAYVEAQIHRHICDLPKVHGLKIGEVEGTPNVIMVGEPTEAGDQAYEYILEHERTISIDEVGFKNLLVSGEFTDALVFPDADELLSVLRILKDLRIDVHMDFNFGGSIPRTVRSLGRPLKTLFSSTSSSIFKEKFVGRTEPLKDYALKYSETFIFKENRGGSRCWTRKSAAPVLTPAFVSTALHSVGIGDCFDAVYLSLARHATPMRLRLASLTAQQYAMTMDTQVFLEKTKSLTTVPGKTVMSLKGISLPWEMRDRFNVYIAAPDFASVDVRPIDEVCAALRYHNFSPHRPVKEHGEITPESPPAKRLETASRDIELLKRCQALVAIPIYSDPGTYIEMGYALELGIPVFVYAPFCFEENLLAIELPSLVTGNLDRLISAIFECADNQFSI